MQDEQPVQLVKETHSPIRATAQHAQRVDYEYERAGTASIFIFTEPLYGWREATARGAFHDAFRPARARAMVERLRFCHTTKNGSWLNIADNELSSLTRQCVSGRRFGAFATLQSEITARSAEMNTTQRGVD